MELGLNAQLLVAEETRPRFEPASINFRKEEDAKVRPKLAEYVDTLRARFLAFLNSFLFFLQRCNTEPCPFWESWIPQGECSRSCDRGEMVETRLCRHGIVGQAGCEGNSTRIVSCQIAPCPSAWSEWSMYGSCSASCGGGTRNRTRICMVGKFAD